MKVYISGPMTGIDEMNYQAFYAAEKILIDTGAVVVNPARIGEQLDRQKRDNGLPHPEYKDYMAADLAEIPHCAAIYMLKGWEKSKGAMIEFTVAKLLGLRVYFER